MKTLTLQICLDTGPVIPLVLNEPLARQIYERWKTRDFHVKNETIIHGRAADNGLDFAVEVAHVTAILMGPTQTGQPQSATKTPALRPPQGPGYMGMSGHN